MTLKVDSLKSSKEWDEFLIKNKASFLQSTEWGDFKKEFQKVRKIEIRENNKLRGVCQFFEEKTPFGNYFYIPYGPVAKEKDIREKLFLKVFEIGRKEGKIFVKAEPEQDLDIGISSFRRIQARRKLFIKAEKDPELMIPSFDKSTRYNIKYARRKGVSISNEKDIDLFFSLIEKTERRQRFKSYPKNYFSRMISNLDSDVILARHKGKVIGSLILVYFGETAIFTHSAFDYHYRKLKATSLMRFEAMKIAKEKGCKLYDFGGVEEDKYKGVAKFKEGFGGSKVLYPEGKDIPIRKLLYYLYYIAILFKNKLRE